MNKIYTSFVDFIIPTYNRYDQLKSLLYSLVSQYDPDWSAQVIIDDVENNLFVSIVESFNDSRISYTFTGQRYNDWGHTPREIGKQQSTSQYVIMTGDDNYYTPNTVQEIKASAKDYNIPGLIYWDMIHSHLNYKLLECKLLFGQIDMGAFATRRDIAQKIKLNNTYTADGWFIHDLNTIFPNEDKIKIDKVLFVHN